MQGRVAIEGVGCGGQPRWFSGAAGGNLSAPTQVRLKHEAETTSLALDTPISEVSAPCFVDFEGIPFGVSVNYMFLYRAHRTVHSRT